MIVGVQIGCFFVYDHGGGLLWLVCLGVLKGFLVDVCELGLVLGGCLNFLEAILVVGLYGSMGLVFGCLVFVGFCLLGFRFIMEVGLAVLMALVTIIRIKGCKGHNDF